MRRSTLLGALVVSLAACAGGQTRVNLFSTEWEDDRGTSVSRVRGKLARFDIPEGANVVVAVSGHADGVLGYDLEHGTKWKFSHQLDARPYIAGHVVVLSGGHEVVLLDAETGAKVWSRPTGGLSFLGAGDDGSVTVLAFSRGSARGSSLLAILRDGTVARQIETSALVGVPAVVHGHAFVPWAGQYVSVIDLSNGDEVGRVVLREKVTRAWLSGGGLYFGELGIVRWDDQIRDASRGQANRVGIPDRALPGAPILMDPGNEPLSPIANARDSVRLYARPSADPASPLTLDAKTYYSTYFKVVLGLDAKDAHVTWAHAHEGADIVGGAAVQGGFLACDADGKLFSLRAKDGAVVSEQGFGEPIRSCSVQTDSFRGDKAADSPGTLASELSQVIRSDDLRLTSEQRLLLRDLGALKDDLATKTIIDVASDPRAAPELIDDARKLLAKRRTGVAFMKEALERRYDYLHDVLRAPPVGPLADAVAGVHEASAAPLLARHLLNPASTVDDVRRAAVALLDIGTANELDALRQFFAMNRTIPDDDDLSAAAVAAGRAIARIDPGATGRGMVNRALRDGMTTEAVLGPLTAAMREVDEAAADAGAHSKGADGGAGRANGSRNESGDGGAH